MMKLQQRAMISKEDSQVVRAFSLNDLGLSYWLWVVLLVSLNLSVCGGVALALSSMFYSGSNLVCQSLGILVNLVGSVCSGLSVYVHYYFLVFMLTSVVVFCAIFMLRVKHCSILSLDKCVN
jgi:cytochrome b subunit of formate dehydrogenase